MALQLRSWTLNRVDSLSSQHKVNYHLLLAVPHYPHFLPFAESSSVCASLTALDVFCCLCENPSVCYSLLAVGPNVPSAPVRRISSQHLEIQMFIFFSINDLRWETEWAELQKERKKERKKHILTYCRQISLLIMPNVQCSLLQRYICCRVSWLMARVMLSGQLLDKWLIISGKTCLASLEIKSEIAVSMTFFL